MDKIECLDAPIIDFWDELLDPDTFCEIVDIKEKEKEIERWKRSWVSFDVTEFEFCEYTRRLSSHSNNQLFEPVFTKVSLPIYSVFTGKRKEFKITFNRLFGSKIKLAHTLYEFELDFDQDHFNSLLCAIWSPRRGGGEMKKVDLDVKWDHALHDHIKDCYSLKMLSSEKLAKRVNYMIYVWLASFLLDFMKDMSYKGDIKNAKVTLNCIVDALIASGHDYQYFEQITNDQSLVWHPKLNKWIARRSATYSVLKKEIIRLKKIYDASAHILDIRIRRQLVDAQTWPNAFDYAEAGYRGRWGLGFFVDW